MLDKEVVLIEIYDDQLVKKCTTESKLVIKSRRQVDTDLEDSLIQDTVEIFEQKIEKPIKYKGQFNRDFVDDCDASSSC